MASPFEFADLSPYTRLATEQLLDQSRRNPLEEMIKAYQAPQKYAQEQAAAELSAQIQRANLESIQRANDPNSPENKMRLAMDQARLAALQRAVPTNLENAIQQSAQLALARQQGVVGATQIPGMPATLPALPVSPEAQRAILATPDEAAPIDQVISPLEAPVRLGGGQVFDPQTAAAMRQRAASEDARRKFAEAQMMERAKTLKVSPGESVILERDPLTGETIQQYTAPKKSETLRGYDTVTKTFGIFEADEKGMFPKGVVPQSQAPKATGSGKPLPTTQSDQFAGLNLLDKKLDEIEKTPSKVRASNVGWIDSTIGWLQSKTGVGTTNALRLNEPFRNAVDALVGEFSFGRGGKALTVTEKEIIKKYLPELTNSDAAFEERIVSFRGMVQQLRESRLEALEMSGYNVDKFKPKSNEAAPSGMVEVFHSDGREGEIPLDQLEDALKAGFTEK